MMPPTSSLTERLSHLTNGRFSDIDTSRLSQAAFWLKAQDRQEKNLTDELEQAWPDFEVFLDHPAYANGTYICHVQPDEVAPYSPSLQRFLQFHTDMAMHLSPPEVTIIHGVCPDDAMTQTGAGANLLVHIEDVVARLRSTDEHYLLKVLSQPCTIPDATGSPLIAPLLPTNLHQEPLRIFDRIGRAVEADYGHALERLIVLVNEWTDLHIEVPLEKGDVLVFSNRHFLHARRACQGVNRITEIALGSFRSR